MASVQELLAVAKYREEQARTPLMSLLEGMTRGVGQAQNQELDRAKALLEMDAQRVKMEQDRQERADAAENQRQLRAEMARKTETKTVGDFRSAGAPATSPFPAQRLASETSYTTDARGRITKEVKNKAADSSLSDGSKITVTPEMANRYEGLVAGTVIPSTFLAEFGQKKAAAQAKTDKLSAKDTAAQDTAIEQADLMISKVDQALAKTSGWSTGVGGAIMRNVPASQAKNLSADLDTIKANLGFSTLAEMRRNSPTGGALGAISEREMQLLTSARASLEQAQSQDQVIQHLNEIKTHYSNWKGAVLKAREDGIAPGAVKPTPKAPPAADHSALLDKYGVP